MLDNAGIDYQLNPRLVRGLDYYSRTVFEWKTDQLGAQDAVCSGGRYDGLVEQLGGRATTAVGFAMGVERLLALMPERNERDAKPHVYMVLVGDAAQAKGVALAEQLRNHTAGWRVMVNMGGGSFKAQFKRADKSGAAIAVVIAESELENETVVVKPLLTDQEQQTVPLAALADTLEQQLA